MLDELANTRFDELLKEDRLFYEPTEPESVIDKEFRFQFRSTDVFNSKPVPENSNKSDEAKKNPFLDPEDGFVLQEVNSTHLIQMNKFCIYRPQLILHTKTFAAQTDDLDLSDFDASLQLLSLFKQPYVVFYNCGVEAGSSQGHKHLQAFPKPKRDDFEFFMDDQQMKSLIETKNEPVQPPESLNVPFVCYALKIQPSDTASDIYSQYVKCLDTFSHLDAEIKGHNMIMTSEWMCVIPRRHRGRFRVPTNAIGMMGMVWVGTWTERMGWTVLGPASHLAYMGLPVDNST